MSRLLAIALAASACNAGRTVSASDTETRAAAPELVVRRGTLERRVLLTGRLEAVRSIELKVPQTELWQLTIQWLVDEGAVVATGDRLVEFDNSTFTADLESKRLMVKQARLDFTSQRSLQRLALDEKRHAVARQIVLRDKAQLYADVEKDLLPERTWQERQLALERALAALATARSDLAALEKSAALDVEVKRIALAKAERAVATAEDGIGALTLAAERDGLVVIPNHPWEGGRKIQAGDVVRPGWTVAELPDLSEMRVAAALSDVDDGRIAVGMPADVIFDAFPERVLGAVVKTITPVAREVAWRSQQRAFDVRLALDETEPAWMRPGMSVRVEVRAGEVADAILVPRASIDTSGGPTRVRLPGGESRAITLGACNAHACVAGDGVDEGQRVVAGETR